MLIACDEKYLPIFFNTGFFLMTILMIGILFAMVNKRRIISFENQIQKITIHRFHTIIYLSFLVLLGSFLSFGEPIIFFIIDIIVSAIGTVCWVFYSLELFTKIKKLNEIVYKKIRIKHILGIISGTLLLFFYWYF
jgi:hypothetical protein